jgi:hypothetical protein
MNRKANTESGFTIIELLLAMAFVSVLLVLITLTVIQIGNIYNKGLTMRSVNQSGTLISNDIRQTVSQSQPFNTDTAFVMQQSNLGVTTNPDDAFGGRLCTGAYSYIWNIPKSTSPTSPPILINTFTSGSNQIGFVRVRDSGGQYCSAANLGHGIDTSDAANAREFLAVDNASLAIQSFNITKIVDDAAIGQALYRVVFRVGTSDRTLLDTVANDCKPPSDEGSLQDFCSVNEFDFTVQAGNGGIGQ